MNYRKFRIHFKTHIKSSQGDEYNKVESCKIESSASDDLKIENNLISVTEKNKSLTVMKKDA